MIDKTLEMQEVQYEQMEFLVRCAILKKTPNQVDKIIYQIESIRREVIL